MNSLRHSIEDIYPLSPMQRGILFHALLDEGSGVYFEQRSCAISGPLDVAAFKTAWQRVVERHSILRTAFIWEDLKEPMQVVYSEAELNWTEQDWRSYPAAAQQERLENYLREDRVKGINLTQAPLMHLALFHKAEQVYHFVWSTHHLLLDGWSGARLLQEVFVFYQSLRRGASPTLEPSRQYGDYIEWLQQQNEANAESFWRRTLKGFTSPTTLGLDHAPATAHKQVSHHSRQETLLAPALTKALDAFARRHQLTLNTLVQGAWALLLSRYNRQDDVVFGATVSGRPVALAGVETILGNFINTLPVRVRVRREARLNDWLKELQELLSELLQYEYSSLVQVQGWSEVPRTLPLFESLIVFENYPTDSAFQSATWQESVQLGLSDIRSDDLINLPLAIGVEPAPASGLTLRMVYDSRRFDDATIAMMLGHLQTTLEAFVAHPTQPLKSLTFLTDAERRRTLFEWNDTRRAYPAFASIPELFAAQARRTPESVAVCFEGQQLTYRELDAITDRVARRLQQLGVAPESVVGVYLERSLEMVVSLLAVLKAGGAYMPLEPSYPRERLLLMLNEARPPVLITHSLLAPQLPEVGANLLCLDVLRDALAPEEELNAEPPVCQISGGSLAYVIYTSGSTGQPKGVMNTHEGIWNRLLWMQDEFQLTEADRVLQKTPFSFDVSVWEFFWPLLHGARLIVARPDGHQDSSYLSRLIAEQHVTIVHFVPSMLRIFLDDKGLEACRSLRAVICSGEALPVELERRFAERFEAPLYNLYGPTEAAIDVTSWRCGRDNIRDNICPTVPIGRPIANTRIYLLDEEGQPVPVDVAGELYIGGINLARGYLRRAALTAEKFVPDPFAPTSGARLYRTGDIARFHADGRIEFLGRADAQVKIRGFRIELGEIENTLSRYEKVREAVVVAEEGSTGDKRLLAYLVLNSGVTADVAELRGFLRQTLPLYMLPSDFVFLDALPLTTSGKVDRRRLPPPDHTRANTTTPFVTPRTPAEEELAAMWRELLGRESIGVHDDFFELGGHSLMLMQLVVRINEAFQVDLPLRVLFEAKTIVEMTTVIAARQIEQQDPTEMAQMLDELNDISPEEMQKLLAAENKMTV